MQQPPFAFHRPPGSTQAGSLPMQPNGYPMPGMPPPPGFNMNFPPPPHMIQQQGLAQQPMQPMTLMHMSPPGQGMFLPPPMLNQSAQMPQPPRPPVHGVVMAMAPPVMHHMLPPPPSLIGVPPPNMTLQQQQQQQQRVPLPMTGQQQPQNHPLFTTPLTLYIGKIPAKLTEAQLKRILESFGKVLKWSRLSDTVTSALKPFGFVTFEHGGNALKCRNVLSGMTLDQLRVYIPAVSEALQVKAGTKETQVLESMNQMVQTQLLQQQQIKEFQDQQHNIITAAAAAAEAASTTSDSDTTTENTSQTQVVVEEVIMAAATTVTAVTAHVTDSSTSSLLSDPDAEVRSKVIKTFESIGIENGLIKANSESSSASSFTSFSSSSATTTTDESINNNNTTTIASTSTNNKSSTPGEAEAVSVNDVHNNSSSNSNSSNNDWNDLEFDANELDKEKNILSEIEKFRQKQLQRDKDVNEQRKLRLRESIAMLKEKQERDERELKRKKDAEEKALLLQQQEEALAKSLRNAEVSIKNTTTVTSQQRHVPPEASAEELEAKKRRKQQVLEALTDSSSSSSSSNTNTLSQSVTIPANTPAITATTTTISSSVGAAASSSLKIDLSKSNKMKTTTAGLFRINSEDEHAGKRQREIVPLDITEEERRQAAVMSHTATSGTDALLLAQKQAQALTAVLTQNTTAAADKVTEENKLKEKLKQLVDKIPTDKDKLFAYEVDWQSADRYSVIDSALKSWVVRKMVEYLGEEEATLTDFIMNKLNSHCKPQELLTELMPVLDEDAEQFVIKLWRMLIYSILKQSVTSGATK